MEHRLHTGVVGSATHLKDGIGLIAVRNLDMPQAPAIMSQLIEDLGSVRGLILDLRGTYGNNFTAGIHCVPLFIESGEVFRFQKKLRSGTASSIISLTSDAFCWAGSWSGGEPKTASWKRLPKVVTKNAPILVLIDNDTRGAAHVIASALKLNGVANLWGNPTLGRFVPGRYFAVNNGKLLRLVLSQEKTAAGEWQKDDVMTVPGCEPHKRVNTHSLDEMLTRDAQAYLVEFLSKKTEAA